MRVALLVLLLAGCASSKPPPTWYKAGASPADFKIDAGQCRAQAAGGSPNMVPLQMAMIYSACLEGKGWERQTQ